MSYIVKNLHFLVIHVPIAMLLFSFLFDLVAKILKKEQWHIAGLLCLIIGTLGAIAAVITGPENERNPLFPQHELYGKITMFFFIVLTLIRIGLLWRSKLELGRNWVYLVGALIGVVLVSYTGHLGGQMVHPDFSKFNGQFNNGQMRQGPGEGGMNGQPGGRQRFQQGGGQRQQQGGGKANGSDSNNPNPPANADAGSESGAAAN
ncbi:hypothetical protein B5M42_002030 [Paenibacillus athensensis]|uniref:DUF2231 domain-containing protein n=1 Tax=Paenibacillus athensensis TaxID=1967502 RepID=A0A4Y8QB68_9BACL|nr:DUF2231 domain-containing protein [Paenibacillus athensensis]MCD1257616.1 hypothetical protein [Paenibacillus athensensis]